MPPCRFCHVPFPNHPTVRQHEALAPACRKARDQLLSNLWASRSTGLTSHVQSAAAATEDWARDDGLTFHDEGPSIQHDESTSTPVQPMDQRACAEDLPDDDWRGQSWQEVFPSHLNAGASYGVASTQFEKIQDKEILEGGDIWGPFGSDEEWQLVKWLIKNVGHTQAKNFLRLGIVSHSVQLASCS